MGVSLTAASSAAGGYAWSMLREEGGGKVALSAPIAELASYEGGVKTRHREFLAWADPLPKGELPEKLREGDRIRTLADAHAEVRYDDGLVVFLDPNSQITVHGAVIAGGERRVNLIDIADGSLRVKVGTGHALALRDAAGHDQGALAAVGEGSPAEVSLHAPEEADGSVSVKAVGGSSVAIEVPTPSGGATGPTPTPIILNVGEGHELGTALATWTPVPMPSKVAMATSTPIPPLLQDAPELPTVECEASCTIAQPLPPRAVAVTVQGVPAVVKDGRWTVAVHALKTGRNQVDVIYRFSDGRVYRQVQRIRVR